MQVEWFLRGKIMLRSIRGALCAACLAPLAADAADPMVFREYFAAGASMRAWRGACDLATPAAGFSGLCDDSGTGSKVLGGYRMTRHTALEIAYDAFGRASATGTLNGAPIDGRLRGNGVSASLVGWLPVGDDWDIGVKAGLMRWSVRAERYLSTRAEIRDDGFNATAGVAVTWYFQPQAGLRVDLDRHFAVGDAGTVGRYDIDALTIGLVLRF